MNTIKKFINDRPDVWLLTYWIFYIIYFIWLETYRMPKYIIYSPIDDFIPFQAVFIIPYIAWFPLLAVSLGYFLFYSKQSFQDLCFLMFTGMTVAFFIYTIFPNGLNLRVDDIGTGFCASIVRYLQEIDSPTNVCPSIHVSSTLAITAVTLRYHKFTYSKFTKIGVSILAIFIVLSTMFLKQHSIIDVISGIVVTGILYIVTYHMNWRSLCSHTFLKKFVE